jgi:signal transduction histidine kinase
VQTQLSSHFPGSVGLLDPTGVILYSANESYVGANVFGSQFRASLPSAFRQPFYSMINQSLKGSTGFQDFSLNGAGGTFAYQPVSVSINGRNQTYAREAAILFVGLPHVLAADQAAQIALQESISTVTIAGIGGASAVAALVVLRWNRNLDKTVKERTAELLSANEELKRRDEAQHEFINTAAHELRTPVQPLLGMTENLLESMKEKGTNKVELSEMEAEMMARNARRLEDLTKNILDVTRLESNRVLMKREMFDINDIIKDTVEGFSVRSPANPDMKKVVFLPSGERLTADVDKTRVSEVVSNLISNALKYSRPEGDGRVVVSTWRKGPKAFVRVKDTGQGIDHDSLPRLFTKFFTKSDSGVGLGLYVSKLVVDAHGGRIWAENNEDGPGASFIFTIPLALERKASEIPLKANESMETPADDSPR